MANAVRAGETVNYTVTPIYRGTELIPRGLYDAGDRQRRLQPRTSRS